MTIFLSDMETCFAYMLLLPVGHSLMQDSRPIVWYMTVSNRDAVTARGITVGDSLKKVMDIYGRPDFIDFNN